ncbi:hypothetical protein SVIOM74S_10030 [Streptomyces violarus]
MRPLHPLLTAEGVRRGEGLVMLYSGSSQVMPSVMVAPPELTAMEYLGVS